MSMPTLSKRIAIAGLAAAGLATAGVSVPAHAQGGGAITVYAPRHQERDPYTGAPIEVTTASRAVYYGDLDLSAAWGVHTLHARVVRAAVQVCDELDNTPGLLPEDSDDCIQPAVRHAMDQAPIRHAWRYRETAYGYGRGY
jgi:UrcA family protein